MITRKVLRFEYVAARGTGFIKGGMWKLTLACGHEEWRRGSTRVPQVAKCRDCTRAAEVRLALQRAKQHGTLNTPPDRT